MSNVVPAWGLGQVVPEDAIAAWGARLIVTQQGDVDLPPDRQGSDGGPHSQELLAMLPERFPGRELFETVGTLLKEGQMLTREEEDFTLFLDDRIVVHANTNASAGYCYVTAWLYPKGETCACAHNGDGSTTTMLCPSHAPGDPCATMARVTGRRRSGTIRNGTCTNCGWSANGKES